MSTSCYRFASTICLRYMALAAVTTERFVYRLSIFYHVFCFTMSSVCKAKCFLNCSSLVNKSFNKNCSCGDIAVLFRVGFVFIIVFSNVVKSVIMNRHHSFSHGHLCMKQNHRLLVTRYVQFHYHCNS